LLSYRQKYSTMKKIETGFKGLYLLQPSVFEDDRGYFYESWNEQLFEKLDIPNDFKQDNQSKSVKNVLRGLHFQCAPFAQAKLVRVVSGAVLDVAVDLRVGSPTYGQTYTAILSEVNKTQMYIPVGFAHGFLTLEDNTVFSYKCSNFYNKESEGSLRWDDPDLAIEWELKESAILSGKDAIAPLFKDFISPFKY